ncbi:hypothetical protein [Bradyrhizobium jicamae]|uniref:hypothetical protein n=1 Tax=Bradyrhizobium jicamae TaxID=280332 RepID=UPI0020129581|nr:hypothetical protein [Bradyrhizobium jicamae]
MSLEYRAQARSVAWSNPVVWWWAFLTLVSGANIAVWFVLYRELGDIQSAHLGASGTMLMLVLCAGYVFGCAFRSFLPRADVQRICLFDHWLSSVFVGRSVATIAELCFAAQWAVILHQLGTMTGADTVVNIAWIIVPAIIVAECFSWYAVLTTHYLCNAIENSIWAVVFFLVGVALCRLWPEFHGPVHVVLAVSIAGIVAYLAFLMTVDVPMYLNRWRADRAAGSILLHPLDGLHDVRTRWIVTHDLSEWKEEIAWMSLYFSGAVWASLALCVFYSLGDQLPRYRTDPAAIVSTTDAAPVQPASDVQSRDSAGKIL